MALCLTPMKFNKSKIRSLKQPDVAIMSNIPAIVDWRSGHHRVCILSQYDYNNQKKQERINHKSFIYVANTFIDLEDLVDEELCAHLPFSVNIGGPLPTYEYNIRVNL